MDEKIIVDLRKNKEDGGTFAFEDRFYRFVSDDVLILADVYRIVEDTIKIEKTDAENYSPDNLDKGIRKLLSFLEKSYIPVFLTSKTDSVAVVYDKYVFFLPDYITALKFRKVIRRIKETEA